MLGLGQWVEQCNLTMLALQVLAHRASGKNILRLPLTQCLALVTSLYIYIYIYIKVLFCRAYGDYTELRASGKPKSANTSYWHPCWANCWYYFRNLGTLNSILEVRMKYLYLHLRIVTMSILTDYRSSHRVVGHSRPFNNCG